MLRAGMEVTPSVKLVSPLGAGGMGAVWLADHVALRTRVVVKFMLGELDASTSARARFSREAAAAAAVKSPHVVQMFDHGVTAEGLPFIVMEHLEGRDLAAELVQRGALDPATVVTIVTQVAKALGKAHVAGLLHRDIKPDNIFLCRSDGDDELFVKLLDFGIAKTRTAEETTLDGETKTGQVVGTPFYMSPEQVTAQKEVDLRSDLWSLGIVAFEALTGKRPYDGPSFGALAVKIATGPTPVPSAIQPSLPPSVDAWFARACARDPKERFASAREMADGLRAAFEGVVSLPTASSGPADSGRRTRDSGADADRVSIDDDARSRPSFVLASTLDQDSVTERSALARSEPGRVARAGGERGAKAGGGRGLPRATVAVGFAALAGALVAGIAIGGRGKDGAATGVASAASVASAGHMPSSALAMSPASAPPSATELPAPRASNAAEPSVASSADAGIVRPVVASAPSAPSPATTGAKTGRPTPTSRPPVAAASSGPGASAASSARPATSSGHTRPAATDVDVY